MNASAIWPPKTALGNEFALIKQARAAVGIYKKDLADSTVQTYARTVERLKQEWQSQSKLPSCTMLESLLARQSQKSNSFSVARSALIWNAVSRLRALLAEQDRLQKSEDSFIQWVQVVGQIRIYLNKLSEIQQTKRANILEALHMETIPLETKRRSIHKLPQGWQWTLLREMHANRTHSEWFWPCVTLALTGCRPSEIHGAKYEWVGDQLLVKIQGTKITSTSGQPTRTFQIDTTELPKFLIKMLRNQDKWIIKFPLQKNGTNQNSEKQKSLAIQQLRMRVTRLSRELWPSMKSPISPITFRHAMASALRGDDRDAGEIAAILGHRSEKTQQYYGVSGKTASHLGPSASIKKGTATAERPIRPAEPSVFLSSNPPQLPKKINHTLSKPTGPFGLRI